MCLKPQRFVSYENSYRYQVQLNLLALHLGKLGRQMTQSLTVKARIEHQYLRLEQRSERSLSLGVGGREAQESKVLIYFPPG